MRGDRTELKLQIMQYKVMCKVAPQFTHPTTSANIMAHSAPVKMSIDGIDNCTANAIYSVLESDDKSIDSKVIVVATDDTNNNCARAAVYTSMDEIIVNTFPGSLADETVKKAVETFRDSVDPCLDIHFVDCGVAA